MNISDLVPWRSRTPARRVEEPFFNMRQELNSLFEDFFRDLDVMPHEGGQFGSFTPSVNVSESDEVIEATVELPGMSEDEIDVTLDQDGLTISGEKKEERKEEGKNYFRRERAYGFFRRTIPLSSDVVDREQVEASFDKGVLKIRMPKRETARTVSRRIEVKSG